MSKACEYSECKFHPAAHPRLKRYGDRCTRKEGCIFSRTDVRNVLGRSVGAVNIESLSDDEIKYCIFHEKRKSGLDKLRAEMKRRKKEASKEAAV